MAGLTLGDKVEEPEELKWLKLELLGLKSMVDNTKDPEMVVHFQKLYNDKFAEVFNFMAGDE